MLPKLETGRGRPSLPASWYDRYRGVYLVSRMIFQDPINNGLPWGKRGIVGEAPTHFYQGNLDESVQMGLAMSLSCFLRVVESLAPEKHPSEVDEGLDLSLHG
jgi:hypothetical protein